MGNIVLVFGPVGLFLYHWYRLSNAFVAKDIAEGDEILFDYGGDFPLDTSDTIVVD